MSKKYFFIFVIAISFISGCSIKNGQNGGGNSADSNAGQNQEQNRENNQNQTQRWQENFDEASSTALVLGEKIMVMGSENSDGSIVAERIIIGGMPPTRAGGAQGAGEDFGMPDFGMRQLDNNADSSSRSQEGARQWNFEGGARPDFQNMSEEERMALREQMRARLESGESGFNGAQAGDRIRARIGAQMARLAGEILANDETSITLKLDGGGSKLIFLSSSTAIMKPKEK